MMCKPSIKKQKPLPNKLKFNRHDMRKILRKNRRYKYDYLDNHFEDKTLSEIPFMNLSCELCRKFVSTIVPRAPDDNILYERYTQFQVICYSCYNTKLEYVKPNGGYTDIICNALDFQSFPKNLLTIPEERQYKHYSRKDKTAWYHIYRVTKEELSILIENQIPYIHWQDVKLVRNINGS